MLRSFCRLIRLQLRELFRERVVLEKEYGSKLQALAKKAGEKKTKRMSKMVLGDEPTQLWTEETVRSRYEYYNF